MIDETELEVNWFWNVAKAGSAGHPTITRHPLGQALCAHVHPAPLRCRRFGLCVALGVRACFFARLLRCLFPRRRPRPTAFAARLLPRRFLPRRRRRSRLAARRPSRCARIHGCVAAPAPALQPRSRQPHPVDNQPAHLLPLGRVHVALAAGRSPSPHHHRRPLRPPHPSPRRSEQLNRLSS